MKLRFKPILIAIFAFMLIFLVGCAETKPIEGYISDERVDEIVKSFGDTTYTKYSYEGNLNYFAYDEELVPRTVTKRNLDFIDSIDKYSNRSASYYLRLPLHITEENWFTEELVEGQGLSASTEYQLISKVSRPASATDRVYFYEREEGGFILRAFGINKALIIKNPSDITCHAKWNIEIVYDKDGYLVSEKFETINTSTNNDSECCYGQATYKFS